MRTTARWVGAHREEFSERTTDGRFQIVWAHCIVRNAARFNVCLYSSTISPTSRREDPFKLRAEIVKGPIHAIVIFSCVSSRRSCRRYLSMKPIRFNRIIIKSHACNDSSKSLARRFKYTSDLAGQSCE